MASNKAAKGLVAERGGMKPPKSPGSKIISYGNGADDMRMRMGASAKSMPLSGVHEVKFGGKKAK